LQQLIEVYQESVLQAARQIEDAAITVKKTAEAQVLIDSAVTAAERSLELANSRYLEGYSDFQRVLDTQRALFAQTERQLTNHAGHLSAVVSLYKGLGGGWVSMPVEQLIPDNIRKSMQERSDWDNLLIAPLPESPAGPASINEASPQ
jgi:outer membrane protein TolC